MGARRSTPLAALAAIAAMALAGALVAPVSHATEPDPATRSSGSERASGTGTLAVSPTRFVSGQSLTWSGRLPQRGVRTITLQRFLNRPGDSWLDVDGFQAKTKADGSFSFRYPAPDMIDIGFRVKSGRLVTEKLDLFPDQQDVVLWAEQSLLPGSGQVTATRQVVAGLPFTIVADTVPKSGMPVFPGRILTLQRRVDATTWVPVGVTVVGPTGQGRFLDLTQGIGTPVYRVLEADVTSGAHRIGWFPSYPTYVDVTAPTGRPAAATRTPARPEHTAYVASSPRLKRGAGTAALKWNWGYPIFDFDWTSGESLTSKPWRGSRPRGVWTEYLGGTGRVAKRSGQLGLSSGRTDRYGSGNRGTTATTLQGNAQSYGRWETKLRTVTLTGGARYLVRAELVPERARDYDCGAHNITIAEIRQGQSSALIGAAKGADRWTRTINLGNIESSAPSVAVELMDDHVTWFVDSRPVGVLKERRITGGVPMTLRLSLVGDGDAEMANTTLLSDWQRGFPLNRSPGVLEGPSLTKSAREPGCGAQGAAPH